MKILIAEDDAVSRKVLESTLLRWGYELVVTHNGEEAWQALNSPDAPSFALLDWMMPALDGVDLIRRVRSAKPGPLPYLVLLTAKTDKQSLVVGLDAGADDYLTKPFDRDELRARIQVGCRLVDTVTQLRFLEGILPICCYCKKIRDDGNAWQQLESYITEHTDARFSHGICPDCMTAIVKPELERFGSAE